MVTVHSDLIRQLCGRSPTDDTMCGCLASDAVVIAVCRIAATDGATLELADGTRVELPRCGQGYGFAKGGAWVEAAGYMMRPPSSKRLSFMG